MLESSLLSYVSAAMLCSSGTHKAQSTERILSRKDNLHPNPFDFFEDVYIQHQLWALCHQTCSYSPPGMARDPNNDHNFRIKYSHNLSPKASEALERYTRDFGNRWYRDSYRNHFVAHIHRFQGWSADYARSARESSSTGEIMGCFERWEWNDGAAGGV